MHIALFPRWHVGVFEAKGTLSGISGPRSLSFCLRSAFETRLPFDCRLSEVDISVFIMFIACLFHLSSVLCFDYPPHRLPAISHFNHQLTSATYIFYRLSFQMIMITYSLPPHLSSLNISIPLPRICFRVLTAMRYSTSNYAKSSNSIPHLAAHPVEELHTDHIIPAL
jgi:hypothetical protein